MRNPWVIRTSWGLLGSDTMFPAAGILVFLLYMLFFHELVTQFWYNGTSQKSPNFRSGGQGSAYRPKYQPTEKKSGHSLDALWRRMKQATENFKLNGLKHALISRKMAEARAEARMLEMEKVKAADL